jgi:hypothetical protein
MSDEPKTEIVAAEVPEADGGALTDIFEAIEAGVSGLPAPIRKNFMKVAAQFFTAAIEIRAASKGRIKLIGTSSNQLAEQLKVDPEYIKAVAHKFTQKVVREQINLDKTTAAAYEDLKTSPSSTEPVADISEDFLNAFEREASQMSSEQMQRLFGKILAREIRRPSAFSIRTVKLVAQLDNSAAAGFRRLCSLVSSLQSPPHIVDARVVSLGANASSNGLQQYGLSFDQLNVLQEYGLIISDYNSYMNFGLSFLQDNRIVCPLTYQKQHYGLVPKTTIAAPTEFRVHGVALSRTGKELLNVTEVEPDQAYTTALVKFFDSQGYLFTRVNMSTSD